MMLRHKRLVDSDGGRRNQRGQPSGSADDKQQASRFNHQDHHGTMMRSRRLGSNEDDEVESDPEDRWRQAAQMLTDDDEIQLFATTTTTKTKPRDRSSSSRRPQQPVSPTGKVRLAVDDGGDEDDDDDDDDNSSISFAQSGCHSILSAWRLKAAHRSSRASSRRPTSVLSNASSAGKKSATSTQYTSATGRGKSPGSQNRIALGPKAAQHFVTNTRRRRQANELILSTLEARRRLLAMNRQNASLFGSASYLDGAGPLERPSSRNENEPLLLRDSASGAGLRLSLSPSPIATSNTTTNTKSPSPAPRHHQSAALSDLGGASRRSGSTAVQAQRQRLLMMGGGGGGGGGGRSSNSPVQSSNSPRLLMGEQTRPPLAKLDQNSSDLYSSNSSTSTSSSSSSESSGSQFTQLVTRELAPDCVLLDEEALKPRLLSKATNDDNYRQKIGLGSHRSPRLPALPPKVPARGQRAKPEAEVVVKQVVEEEEEDESQAGRLRRGALRRDSIRRLRLNRSSMMRASSSSTDAAPTTSSDSSSNSNSNSNAQASISNQQQQQPQSLSKTRRLDIESNPFLNRHHFRSTSVRSSAPAEDDCSQGYNPVDRLRQQPDVPRATTGSSQEVAAPANKRSSWLFGLTSAPKNNNNNTSTTTTSKPKLFSEARRSSSSEKIGRNSSSSNKKSKQQQQEEEEEIRQVERMLRQMRPNQVFTSYAKESNESKAIQSINLQQQQQPVARQQQQQPVSTSRRHDMVTGGPIAGSGSQTHVGLTTVPSLTKPNDSADAAGSRSSYRPNQTRMRSQDSTSHPSEQAAPLTHHMRPQSPGRFVREASKSQDDLKFDLTGNRRELQVEERWRHEHNGGPNEQIDRVTSQRMEILRSSSISPPMGFADHQENRRRDTNQSNASRARPTQPRQQHTAAPSTATPRRSLSEDRPAVAARRPQTQPQSPPVVPQRPAALFQQQQPPVVHPVPPTQYPKTVPRPAAPPIKEPQLSLPLPKFERTADDEFRKRVDYLRKLARANLNAEDKSHMSAATSSLLGGASSQEHRPAPTTKPMSTNWRQSVPIAMEGQQQLQQRDSQSPQLGPIEARTRWNYSPLERTTIGRATGRPAATNLDALLVAAGYQEKDTASSELPGPKWRRSNSSLASMPSMGAKRDLEQQQQVRTSPPHQVAARSHPGQPSTSVMRNTASSSTANVQTSLDGGDDLESLVQEPARQLTSSALVKLVVKEKNAPKLDYAFVKQGTASQQTTSDEPPVVKYAPSRVLSQPQPPQPISAQIARGLNRAPQPATTGSHHVMNTATTRSPLRVASPRSPEFGQMATSSNDDSAIASSVSSPSLSFMMNGSGQPEMTRIQHQQQQLIGIRPTTTTIRPAADGSSGALQSILRRQQQQQHQHRQHQQPQISHVGLTESSQSPVAEPCTNMKRNHGEASMSSASSSATPMQQREPYFRSGETGTSSPELSAQTRPSGLQEKNLMASPSSSLVTTTTATVTTVSQQQQQSASSPPKRVHFNDRTSIRSFESVSSLASNSTAVPNPNELLRQQVGSPDSMGSGSTSRLSAESPDFRKGSGAAIYAIRGDPELELDSQSDTGIQQQQQQHHQAQPQPYQQQQLQSYMIQQQQQARQFAPRYNEAPLVAQHQQTQPFIRMTAPPRISTGAISPQASSAVSHGSGPQQMQYLVRPPNQMAVPDPNYQPTQQQHHQLEPDDDDDPNYALRLRQAATSRVFSYVPGIQQQQQQPSPRCHPPAIHLPTNVSSSLAAGQSQHHQQQQQQQQQVPTSRRNLDKLLNFQTEV